LSEAARLLDELQRRYIRLLSDDLAAQMPTNPPPGVTPNDWLGRTAAVLAALARAREATSAAEASEAFRRALSIFLDTVANSLLNKATDKIAKKSHYIDRYEEVRTISNRALEQIRSGDLLTAWTSVKNAQSVSDAIAKQEEPLGGAGVESFVQTLVAMTAGPAGAAVQFATPWAGAPAADLARPGAMKRIDRQILRDDILTSILFLALAVLIGHKALYMSDMVWGGWTSYLAAFLWGVAFDQVGHAGLVTMIRR
jgi:hypothetical protein